MSVPYLDQDTRDEIQRAKNSGKPVAYLAGQVGCSVEDLCRLMGWPQWAQVPADDDTPFDLFACERLDGVL
jgi:hypothetical protein